jgi:hypothetical protein
MVQSHYVRQCFYYTFLNPLFLKSLFTTYYISQHISTYMAIIVMMMMMMTILVETCSVVWKTFLECFVEGV